MNKKQLITIISIGITAALHILFFYTESINFMDPATLEKFGLSPEQGLVVKLWAFNLGFYNLFLAFGLLFSIYLVYKGLIKEGKLLATYLLLFIVGAGIVLYISEPGLLRIALTQALPALISLILVRQAFLKSAEQ